MARPTPAINLSREQSESLDKIARSREVAHSLSQRVQIVISAAEGNDNKSIAERMGLCEETVGYWRRRWIEGRAKLEESGDNPKKLRVTIEGILSDRERSGSPGKFTPEQLCQVIAVACEGPPDHISHWSRKDLASEIVKRGIAKAISLSSIGRFLKSGDLKPHRHKYWLNHEVEDEAEFREDVGGICKLYHQAQELHEQGTHVISVDEKTGIQALERTYPTHPMKAGKPEAQEFEYTRHGTQALIANFEVATGKVISPSVGDTRTEEDFATHIRATAATYPVEDKIVIIADQLNTHKSATLVRLISEICGIEDELGEKGKLGILKDMPSRAAFLQDESHRIHFVYTPKHCSWLNQIEIWFGILTRRLLKRGNFKSTEELKQRILAFIEFFNRTLAKPFRWTYIGKPLMA